MKIHLPRGSDEWNAVAAEYIRTTKDIRDVHSIKNKYNTLKATSKTTGNPTMLQNVRDAKEIEQSIDIKSDAITLGGEDHSLYINTNADINEDENMWGPVAIHTPKTVTPTHLTHSSKRKRKLEDTVNVLVEHITKAPTPTSSTTSEHATLTQIVLEMQKQQQQMINTMTTIQTQLQNIQQIPNSNSSVS